MREDLMDLICCPDCRSELRLEATKRDTGGEILEGALTCSGCGHAFPIRDGIPNLLPAALGEE